MSEIPKFIEWEAVGRTAQQTEELFYEARKECYLDIERAENLGTFLHTDEADRAGWKYIGRSPIMDEDSAARLAEYESKVKDKLGFIVGESVEINANYHCYQKDSGWVEEIEEYSPVTVSGIVMCVAAAVTTYKTGYHRGFEPKGMRLPCEGEFKHFRVGLLVDGTLVPILGINGAWNKLKVTA